MTNTRLRLFAHPCGGARAEIDVHSMEMRERARLALAMCSAVFSGRLRMQIPHAVTSVRGRLNTYQPEMQEEAVALHDDAPPVASDAPGM